jgi:hypothetical protein
MFGGHNVFYLLSRGRIGMSGAGVLGNPERRSAALPGAFDLLTGEVRMQVDPSTGKSVLFAYSRNYGCGPAATLPWVAASAVARRRRVL